MHIFHLILISYLSLILSSCNAWFSTSMNTVKRKRSHGLLRASASVGSYARSLQ